MLFRGNKLNVRTCLRGKRSYWIPSMSYNSEFSTDQGKKSLDYTYTKYGHIILVRTPCKDDVQRRFLYSPTTACFDVPYNVWNGIGAIPAMELINNRWRSRNILAGSQFGSAGADPGFFAR